MPPCRTRYGGFSCLQPGGDADVRKDDQARIPAAGEGTARFDCVTDMFARTGGTFTGTPAINTTYYLHESNSVAG